MAVPFITEKDSYNIVSRCERRTFHDNTARCKNIPERQYFQLLLCSNIDRDTPSVWTNRSDNHRSHITYQSTVKRHHYSPAPLLPVLTTITVTIVRGTQPTDPVVFSASSNLDLEILGPQAFTFIGSDINVPPPTSGQLTYTAFISANLIGTVRVGPESFNGLAFAD